MTLKEYLLVCLMEEASELQQAAAKCLRFTTEDKYVSNEVNNLEQLVIEYNDLLTIIQTLQFIGIDIEKREDHIRKKFSKLLFFVKHSRELGALRGPADEDLSTKVSSL